MCQDNYLNDKREPPCYQSDNCKFTRNGEIFELLSENRLAWDIYLDVQGIGGYDRNGLPTIDKLDFYLNRFELGVDALEMEKLIDKIMFIHSYYRQCLFDKIKFQD